MSRPRLNNNKSLPPNLYFDKSLTMYRYRRPDNGIYTYFGKDKAKAIAAAKKLNSILMEGEELVAKVMSEGKTLTQYINERFIPVHLPDRRLSEETLKGYQNQINHIHKKLGLHRTNNISIKMVGDFLSEINGARQANKYRGLLCTIFTYAKAEGFTEINPAESALIRMVNKQRLRLKYEEYKAIHKLAAEKNLEWFCNAMDLGLLTLQRREEVVHMKFSDIETEIKDGNPVKILKVIQKKTQKHGASAYIKIILNAQLEALIAKCRNSGLPSPFIVHRRPDQIVKSKKKKHHTQVLPDYLSHKFAEIRDETGLFKHLEVLERPTFHEIRSLGIKLHEDAGYDAQALAGHTNRQMTEHYKKGHGEEWTYAPASHLND